MQITRTLKKQIKQYSKPIPVGYLTMFIWFINLVVASITLNMISLSDQNTIRSFTSTFALSLNNPSLILRITGIFTYSLLSLFFTHFLYNSALMHYYVRRAEHFWGKKWTLLAYFLSGIIPILILSALLGLFYLLGNNFAMERYEFASKTTFYGASIAVWGTAGFGFLHDRKNWLYWTTFFLLVAVAVIIKLLQFRETSDLTPDLAHVVTFLFGLSLAIITRYYQIQKNKEKPFLPQKNEQLPWYTSLRDIHWIIIIPSMIGVAIFFILLV